MKKENLKKAILFIIIFLFFGTLKVEANSVSSKYGNIKLTNIEVIDDEVIFTSNVNALDKKSKYLVEIVVYRYEKSSLELVHEVGFGEGDIFKYGKNLSIKSSELLCNLEWNMEEEDGIYCFQAILHDAKNYDWENSEPVACFAWSEYCFKNIEWKNGQMILTDYYCQNDGHIYDAWRTTKAATIEKEGQKTRSCYACDKKEQKSIKKLKPTIKLSVTSKSVKELHSFKLSVKNIAKGDSIKTVTVSAKKIISVKRSKNTITVKGKKKGSATITVKLKSGKTSKCKVKVIKDKFTYKVKDLSYSTRTNTFKVKIMNTSKHTVKIYAKDAKLLDWDYKAYDRNVKSVNGKSSITIKPGKTKTIKFKLKSKSTWPGYERKTIKFKIKFDGKTKWIKISENNL